MANNDKLPYLSEIIDLERDILPHRVVLLHAGVGAGKNTWTKILAQKGYRILLITSRRVTADVQAKNLDADKKIDIDRLIDLDDAWGEIAPDVQKRVVCTNSQIENFVKNKYIPDDPKTHIWNKFDFIILDEAHSLTTDASFADSVFYVFKFLKHAYSQNPNCHIIFMTGTPQPIEWMFRKKSVHRLLLFAKCKHVDPENVYLVPSDFAIRNLKNNWNRNQRTIYFTNSTTRILECVKLLTDMGIPEDDIGISYNPSEKDASFSAELIERRSIIEKSLREQECVPKNVKILLTTVKNREGINILDTDIKIMYAESHHSAELTQMAGRVRNGLEKFFVLYDAAEHVSNTNRYNERLEYHCVDSANKTYNDYIQYFADIYKPFPKEEIIKTVEAKFQMIRFNPFSEKFEYFQGRQKCFKQQREDSRELQDIVDTWEVPCLYDGHATGGEVFHYWFPHSKIWVMYKQETKDIVDTVAKYLSKNGYDDKKIKKKQYEELKTDLNKILKACNPAAIPCAYPIKSLGRALPYFGYSVTTFGKSGANWHITKVGDPK